jgi:hypothetical protein
MKFSLDLDAPLTDEVRRVARLRLAAAADLLAARPDGLDAAIHDARRHIKQCRSLYRLVAREAKPFQERENARLAALARRLSGLRDARALVEVTAYLKHEIPTKANGLLMDRLGRRLEQRRQQTIAGDGAAEAVVGGAVADLDEAARAVADLDLPGARRKAVACLARGWDRTGRKARLAIEATAQDPDQGFHDLRKRCQDRWMQAGLLRALWPTAMMAMRDQAKHLSDLLGHAQDLTVLLETVNGDAALVGDGVESEAITEVVLGERGRLRETCHGLAKTVFGKARPRDRDMLERLLLNL